MQLAHASKLTSRTYDVEDFSAAQPLQEGTQARVHSLRGGHATQHALLIKLHPPHL